MISITNHIPKPVEIKIRIGKIQIVVRVGETFDRCWTTSGGGAGGGSSSSGDDDDGGGCSVGDSGGGGGECQIAVEDLLATER